ncbi:hypothetical protein FW778_06685 [Ginsengibacter hankyongi]|uniref:Uncharacterized protein n=1 Tax=Ginsengibacter hankyongi TaxID=2607284 RepID=A0A5J5ILS9_9BACT|nr:hypothetical protein [Ginsengibacter hankyongi]KAA9041701.1 hypothetical protein FW778_06685 [Ginsengibacter hankyongi]
MNYFLQKYLRFFILPLFSFTTITASAQDDSLFRFLKKIEYPIASFTVDNLGELYIINTDNQLKKYDEQGDSIGVFNQVTKFGKLSYVEAQNPWKAILFYKNYSTIVLLDKYLNVLSSINLRKQNIFQVNALTTSYDNNIWLYDEQDNKLKKLDDSGNKLFETVDFRLLFDSVPSPQKIIDSNGFVYLYDPEKGLYIFDYYGSFKSKLPFLHWTDITVIDKQIYGFDEENLYRYSPPFPDAKKYILSPELQNNNSIKVSNHKIYVLKNQQLRIYSLQ